MRRAFAVVESDPGVRAAPPVHARRLHSKVVYLPFSPEMSEAELDRLGRVVRDELDRQSASMTSVKAGRTRADRRFQSTGRPGSVVVPGRRKG